jgi:hypothetical protein
MWNTFRVIDMKIRVTIAIILLTLTGSTYAEEEPYCSFKVINNTEVSFDDMQTKGTVYNLLIPTCNQNPEKESDPKTAENCAKFAQHILFEHPKEGKTCQVTNGWPVTIQFQTSKTVCNTKKPVKTLNKDVVLNFPEDFNCEELH